MVAQNIVPDPVYPCSIGESCTIHNMAGSLGQLAVRSVQPIAGMIGNR